MPSTDNIKRSPRLQSTLPSQKIEIPQPKSAPTKPTTSLVTVLIPVAGTAMGLGLMAYLASTSGNSMGTAMAFSLPMMAAAWVVGIVNYTNGRRKYKTESTERVATYRHVLQDIEQNLTAISRKQVDILTAKDPPYHICMQRVQQHDSHLWERSPEDDDFLSLRIGTGVQPICIDVELPKNDPQAPDPLVTEGIDLGQKYLKVENSPVLFPLREAAVCGIAGPRQEALSAVRTLAVQLATSHSPDEVKIAAIFPEGELSHWDWLRWLPHVWDDDRLRRFLACNQKGAHELLTDLLELMKNRSLVENQDTVPLPRFVVIIADSRLILNEPAISFMLKHADEVGVYPVFLAEAVSRLPKQCQAIISMSGVSCELIETSLSRRTPLKSDIITGDEADAFARAIAPLRLEQVDGASQIPTNVTLLDLLGVERVEDIPIEANWSSNRGDRSLAVPIGRKEGGVPVILDIHDSAHGPHGLGAGTSGSGKSELIKTLLTMLTVKYAPTEISFVIIDYKGGDTAQPFLDIPHLVGVVSNLDGKLAARALRAVNAEIHGREALFKIAGVSTINEYQRKFRNGSIKKPIPHLLIIVDEFAQIAQNNPEFIKELVSASRVGRSLGLHLLLVTQNPSGVVNDQISANANFQFCFRVQNNAASMDILHHPDAAAIKIEPRGRGYLRVGQDEIFDLFQGGFSKAPYLPDNKKGATTAPQVKLVELDGTRRILSKAPTTASMSTTSALQSQIDVIMEHVKNEATRLGVKRQKGPWLPPLPKEISLSSLRPSRGWDGKGWRKSTSWLSPVIGLYDDPANQLQAEIELPLGEEGHCLIMGAPGTGKTTLIQSIVLSAIQDHSPEDLSVYIMDFGSRILGQFGSLPHCGGVVFIEESEKIQRLFALLHLTLEERKREFSQAHATNLVSYRSMSGKKSPGILVVVDNFPSLVKNYPNLVDPLGSLLGECGSYGIHFVFTCNSPNQVVQRIRNHIKEVVCFEMTDRADYLYALGKTDGIEFEKTAGRGLISGKPVFEFQAALPFQGIEDERSDGIKQLATTMTREWKGNRARLIPALPEELSFEMLMGMVENSQKAYAPHEVFVGLRQGDIEPQVIDLRSSTGFIITGTPQSGKSTLLQTCLLGLSLSSPSSKLNFVLVDYNAESLGYFSNLPHSISYCTCDDDLAEVLPGIESKLEENRNQKRKGQPEEELPHVLIAIDDCDTFIQQCGQPLKERLFKLLNDYKKAGLHIILCGPSSIFTTSYDNIVKSVKEFSSGCLLGTTDGALLSLFSVKLMSEEMGKILKPGDGVYSHRGKGTLVRFASPWKGTKRLVDWIKEAKP